MAGVLPYRDEIVASGNFVYYGNTVPTTGDYALGDVLIITSSGSTTVNQTYPVMYRCTTASSAHNGGTWTAIGQPLGTAPAIVATATAIAPTFHVTTISGTGAIDTITAPTGLPSGSTLILLPSSAFTTTISGNIALASTAVVNKALIMTWNGVSFYPSY